MLRTMEQHEVRQEAMRQQSEAPVAFAEHFTVQELAAKWKLSRRTVQRLVEKWVGRGVVRIGTERPGVRRHFTLRVPASVANQIYLELTGEAEEPARKPARRFGASLLVRRKRAS